MRKFKKFLAAVLASTMVFSAMAVSAFAANGDVVNISKITYNFTVSTFAGAEDLYLIATGADWVNGTSDKVSITKAGDVSFTVSFATAEAKLANLGFLTASADGKTSATKANVLKLNSITINDKYTLVFQADSKAADGKDAIYQTSTVTPSDATLNGLPNIWNDAGKQTIIAADATNGFSLNGDGGTSISLVENSDVKAGDSTTTTALVVAAIAALAVVATVSTKKVAFQK